MKNKKLKYILIFIFIVCLLIPISCINIFALNNATYSFYYSTTSQYTMVSQLYFYNVNKINITNVDYNVNNLEIRQYITKNASTTNIIIYIYNGHNGGTANRIYNNSLNNTSNSDRSSLVVNDIKIYYDDTSYFNMTTNATYNQYSSHTCEVNTNYYVKDYDDITNSLEIYWTGANKRNSVYIYTEYAQSSISFNKTYNLSFYNNDILYDSITISGASASGYAPFEEISQIKYGNTIVYDNSTWSSGYNSTLRYNQLMTEPNVTTINSDCNSIITFTTQYYVDTISFFKTYNVGTFYNDTGQSNEYSSITIIGKVANGTTTPFLEISQIKYDSTLVYDNNTWFTGYSNYLYTNVGTTLSLNSINTDCNNIITFINYYIDARIYEIGTFFIGDNSNTVYSSIQIKGSPNFNNTFSSIDIISYDSTIVYQNGSWVSGYSPNLKYFAYNDIDINQINIDCNNIIVFTKTQAESINPQLHNDLLGGVNVILYPVTSLIEQANNNIVIAIVLMFLVVNFVVSIVFIFIKVKNK